MIIDTDTAYTLSRHLMGVAFFFAAIASALAGRRGFATFYAVATAETYVRLRYPIHNWIRDSVIGPFQSLRDQREFQMIAILAITVIGVIALTLLLRLLTRRGKGRAAMYVGTAGVLAVFMLEFISHHNIDAWLYTYDGIFLRSCWMYALGAIVAMIGAIQAKQAT